MFNHLQAIQADAILSLMSEFKTDHNPNKIDLGVGIYKTQAGITPVMTAVKKAEKFLFDTQNTKAYISPKGSPTFNRLLVDLVLGATHQVIQNNRVVAMQAPGGCGALRLGAELLKQCSSTKTVWVSDPTWANHIPLFQKVGFQIKKYPYYNKVSKEIEFTAMMTGLNEVQAGDVVLINGCCHNPCGADLNLEQWKQLSHLLSEKQAFPYVDLAYQGLGLGLEEDVAGLRFMADQVPEMLIASSCSKNFGLYRERTGALMLIADSAQAASNSLDQLGVIARGIWSMPPAHGAAIVETILSDSELTQEWHAELQHMRERLRGLRVILAESLSTVGVDQDFTFITKENGMFSLAGFAPEHIQALKQKYSIYILNSSRINIAGLNKNNIGYFVESYKKVVHNHS